MLRKVPALTYSSHSTTISISFVVAVRRLYQYKSKLIPKRDEGNTAPPSLTNKQKKRPKKDFSSQFGLLFRLRFVDCNSLTTTHDRNITNIQYPTRSTDTTRRHQYIPCSTPNPDFTREPISLTGRGGFLLHFLRREGILFFRFLFPSVDLFLVESYILVSFSFGISYRYLLVFM